MTEVTRVAFSVSSIECIACGPAFKRELSQILGVKSVRPVVMFNEIIVEIDTGLITVEDVKKRILDIGSKAGFKDRIMFRSTL